MFPFRQNQYLTQQLYETRQSVFNLRARRQYAFLAKQVGIRRPLGQTRMRPSRFRPLHVLAIAVACALPPGCASPPEGVLRPVAKVPGGTERVDMLVATTRAPANAADVEFTGERGQGLSLANIVVSI